MMGLTLAVVVVVTEAICKFGIRPKHSRPDIDWVNVGIEWSQSRVVCYGNTMAFSSTYELRILDLT